MRRQGRTSEPFHQPYFWPKSFGKTRNNNERDRYKTIYLFVTDLTSLVLLMNLQVIILPHTTNTCIKDRLKTEFRNEFRRKRNDRIRSTPTRTTTTTISTLRWITRDRKRVRTRQHPVNPRRRRILRINVPQCQSLVILMKLRSFFF